MAGRKRQWTQLDDIKPGEKIEAVDEKVKKYKWTYAREHNKRSDRKVEVVTEGDQVFFVGL